MESMTPSFLSPGSCGKPEHLSRRTLLRGAGLVGLSWLTPLSQQLAIGAEKSRSRPKSVIVLWLQGGASQLETFDPHPDSAISYGSTSIKTAVKGIEFGGGLERTAGLANEFSVLRSVTGDEGDHARAMYHTKTGFRPFPGVIHPSIGAVMCHELPVPVTGGKPLDIPTHISILPSAFPARGGYLGARFDAFQVGNPVRPVADLSSRVDSKRDEKRFKSLSVLEESFAAGRIPDLEGKRTLHRTSIESAKAMMNSEQLAAFDVSKRPASERNAYGDTPFGRSCLAALELVQAGVRCVEVTLKGWDTHINNHELHLKQNEILDPALASLISGLKERDLYEDTILLVGTEFGRTPKLNVTEGRDHWPHGFSVLLGGGGLRGGLAIGETDPSGEKTEPARKVKVDDVHATILSALGIDYESELTTPIGRPLPLSEGRLIRELL
ncbi:MAG: DUF1501 domain-containing protein [Verrucomicrobiales bacterium]|nr:DUF1501 domain-containing protein [Verrucomicrobiales bacterium]